MELEDLDVLLVQGVEQVDAVGGQLDLTGVAVRGSAGRGHPVVGAGLADAPLDLEARLGGEAFVREVLLRFPGLQALVHRVGDAALEVAVGRCPGPARLTREHREAVEVGVQPQVADRAAA